MTIVNGNKQDQSIAKIAPNTGAVGVLLPLAAARDSGNLNFARQVRIFKAQTIRAWS
jgi:hypothetical protein